MIPARALSMADAMGLAARHRGAFQELARVTGWPPRAVRSILARDVRETTGWRALTPAAEANAIKVSVREIAAIAECGHGWQDFEPDAVGEPAAA